MASLGALGSEEGARELVPSLRDSGLISHLTRHFRAGLSHTAATRLRLGGAYFTVVTSNEGCQ